MSRWLNFILSVCVLASICGCPLAARASAGLPLPAPQKPAPCCCAPGQCRMADCSSKKLASGGCSSRCRSSAPVPAKPVVSRILSLDAIPAIQTSVVVHAERPLIRSAHTFLLRSRFTPPPVLPPRLG